MRKMKRVSARVFFTVLWRGLCQALGWFFGLFGYKREGKFAKCVWGLFAISAAIIAVTVAIAFVWAAVRGLQRECRSNLMSCDTDECYGSEYVSDNIFFHEHLGNKGFIYNKKTKKKTLKHVEWIRLPLGEDSLVCFSNGEKRGYFSMNTGKVVIEPQYDHAWIFSEGLACVEKGGYIKFIDGTGKVIIDQKMVYSERVDGYVFHSGYCVVYTEDGKHYGLIDKTGKIVLPQEYNSIVPEDNFKLWKVQKGEEMAVLDKDLKTVIPLMACSIYIDEGTIDVTMPDHTMRKYDTEGNLIHDFYITSVRSLIYEKDEICYRRTTNKVYDNDNGEEYDETTCESYHPEATARLRAYVAGDDYEGLMTTDGQMVTMPLYKDINAIGHDLYLCTSTNCDKVIVNGKGEIVR